MATYKETHCRSRQNVVSGVNGQKCNLCVGQAEQVICIPDGRGRLAIRARTHQTIFVDEPIDECSVDAARQHYRQKTEDLLGPLTNSITYLDEI